MKPPSGARRRDVKRGKKYKKNEKRKIMKRKKKREYRGITNTKGRWALWGWAEQVLREKRPFRSSLATGWRSEEKKTEIDLKRGSETEEMKVAPVRRKCESMKGSYCGRSEWKGVGANNFTLECSCFVLTCALWRHLVCTNISFMPSLHNCSQTTGTSTVLHSTGLPVLFTRTTFEYHKRRSSTTNGYRRVAVLSLHYRSHLTDFNPLNVEITHWGRGHLNCLKARSRGF